MINGYDRSVSDDRLTTAEAADRLGVKPETLYAYVSRGLIGRRATPGGVSTFAARDVERLARSGRRSRQLPPLVFPSALTLIAEGRLTYRGVDAITASTEHRFEEVAEWLWSGRWPDAVDWPVDGLSLDRALLAQRGLPNGCLPLDRFRVITAVARTGGGGDIGPGRAEDTYRLVPEARRLVRLLVHGLPRADGREARRAEPARGVAEVLWTRLTRLTVHARARARPRAEKAAFDVRRLEPLAALERLVEVTLTGLSGVTAPRLARLLPQARDIQTERPLDASAWRNRGVV